MTYRYDSTGERVEVEDDELPLHRCDDGWLEDDPDTGKARPCLKCKPHLAGPAWHTPWLTGAEWNG